ncbi:MAG: glycoside hydrolase family 5 protein [Saprospiraceae bacterium]|nr:glycoside hydrolase family 5 protein [Saprospiraceae bacterium]
MNRFLSLLCFLIVNCTLLTAQRSEVWSIEQANAWKAKVGWLSGCNFQPSTAINQLEMFQAESFDTATINRELGWAANLGFNCMRVYLHHLAWEVDKAGFKQRLDTYLTISNKQGIKTILVFFDDCWNPEYKAGKQPEPKVGVHNSGWVRDPGDLVHRDSANLYPILEAYVKDVLTTFKNDDRIVLWDLYNEPGNRNYRDKSMPLLQAVFDWGRTVNPSQRLTAGIWNATLVNLNKYQLENSDIITYHNYTDPQKHQQAIDNLKKTGRPLVCTEYMARRNNSLFENILPLLKQNDIGAINWGFVSGKTNTIYAWNAPMPDGSEPKLWFHDILRKDGTPYKQEEIEAIKKATGKL